MEYSKRIISEPLKIYVLWVPSLRVLLHHYRRRIGRVRILTNIFIFIFFSFLSLMLSCFVFFSIFKCTGFIYGCVCLWYVKENICIYLQNSPFHSISFPPSSYPLPSPSRPNSTCSMQMRTRLIKTAMLCVLACVNPGE